MKYPCPCCGHLTLNEKPPGTFEICEVCLWEDDRLQYKNPDETMGANKVSLCQAKKKFNEFGTSDT